MKKIVMKIVLILVKNFVEYLEYWGLVIFVGPVFLYWIFTSIEADQVLFFVTFNFIFYPLFLELYFRKAIPKDLLRDIEEEERALRK